jgi:hypothetical protein
MRGATRFLEGKQKKGDTLRRPVKVKTGLETKWIEYKHGDVVLKGRFPVSGRDN